MTATSTHQLTRQAPIKLPAAMAFPQFLVLSYPILAYLKLHVAPVPPPDPACLWQTPQELGYR